MTDQMYDLLSRLRETLPAPISMCRDAITAANGDLSRAHDIVVQKLTAAVIHRTGTTDTDAFAKLVATQFDVERAIELWNRENPSPEPSPREELIGGIELATSLPIAAPEMKRYAHVIPLSDGRYELRLITHHERFTEDAYGLDYDYALQDSNTRMTRVITENLKAALEQFADWGITEDMLQVTDAFDSCLVHSPIDGYLATGRLPHLWIDDESNTA